MRYIQLSHCFRTSKSVFISTRMMFKLIFKSVGINIFSGSESDKRQVAVGLIQNQSCIFQRKQDHIHGENMLLGDQIFA